MNLGKLWKWNLKDASAVVLSRHKRSAWAMAVAFVCAAAIVLIGLATGSTRKIDANGLLSPWDRSAAPPPYLTRSAVRIVDARPRRAVIAGVPKHNSGPIRVAAGAGSADYRRPSPTALSR